MYIHTHIPVCVYNVRSFSFEQSLRFMLNTGSFEDSSQWTLRASQKLNMQMRDARTGRKWVGVGQVLGKDAHPARTDQ